MLSVYTVLKFMMNLPACQQYCDNFISCGNARDSCCIHTLANSGHCLDNERDAAQLLV